ncbi:MAG: preprotein translocase subunit TatA [Burkholderiaceae bacterium]|nr:preprotein translocase subunit TatA [Burkholderiaceae bacterium]
MGGFSLTHWIILLVVVVLIFGTKKLRNTGRDLGEAVKGFKDGMKGEEEKSAKSLEDASTVEADIKDKSHSA